VPKRVIIKEEKPNRTEDISEKDIQEMNNMLDALGNGTLGIDSFNKLI
jgi:hypothetical protein